MQTISLTKTEQALITAVIQWADEQKQIINNLCVEKLSSILEDHELVGKPCSFDKQEDGSWVIQVPEETTDATQEG